MERKLIDYLPYVIRDYAEFQGIMGSEQPEVEKAWDSADDLLDNQFILAAGNMGLSRWEKILDIAPKGTDTLEDRRFRILTRINEELPYTLPQLRNILETLCGAGGYVLTVSTAMYTVDVKVAIGVKKQAAIVAETLERILPYNMIFTVELLYNTWAMTRPHTWGALTSRTWKSIKEEVEA